MELNKINGNNKLNIEYMLAFTKKYFDRNIDDTEYRLDFPYELELRYKKMVKEYSFLADNIYFYIYESKTAKYYDDSDETFYQAAKENFQEIMDICAGK